MRVGQRVRIIKGGESYGLLGTIRAAAVQCTIVGCPDCPMYTVIFDEAGQHQEFRHRGYGTQIIAGRVIGGEFNDYDLEVIPATAGVR